MDTDNNQESHDSVPIAQLAEIKNAEFISRNFPDKSDNYKPMEKLSDIAKLRYKFPVESSHMILGTPIGILPKNYPFLQELYAAASIGFDEMSETILDTEGKAKQLKIIRWFILRDENLVPRTFRTNAGNTKKDSTHMVVAANKHLCFCMLRDFINFKGWSLMRDLDIIGKLDTANVFDLLLNKTKILKLPNGDSVDISRALEDLRSKDWRGMHNILCRMGVKGYDDQRKPATDLPDFD